MGLIIWLLLHYIDNYLVNRLASKWALWYALYEKKNLDLSGLFVFFLLINTDLQLEGKKSESVGAVYGSWISKTMQEKLLCFCLCKRLSLSINHVAAHIIMWLSLERERFYRRVCSLSCCPFDLQKKRFGPILPHFLLTFKRFTNHCRVKN